MDDSGKVTVRYLEDNIEYLCSISKVKNTTTVEPGDLRKVKWKDGKYYEAKILKIEADGQITVQYTKDKIKYKTYSNDINNCNIQKGDIRLVKWKDGKYYAARILKTDFAKTADLHGVTKRTKRIDKSDNIKGNSNPVCSKITVDNTNLIGKNETTTGETTNMDFEVTKTVYVDSPTLDNISTADCTERQKRRKKNRLKEAIMVQESEESELEDFSPDVSEYTPSHSDNDSDSYHEKSSPVKLHHILTTPIKKQNSTEIETDESKYKSFHFDCHSDHTSKKSIPVNVHHMKEPSIKIQPSIEKECDIEMLDASIAPQNVKVDIAKKKENGKRKWDKKYFCKFCKQSFAKLPRHLQRKHSGEMEVASFLAIEKGPIRLAKIEKIRLEGEKMYNFSVLCNTKSEGLLRVKRRPLTDKPYINFLPCKHCGLMLSRKYLARHVRKCHTTSEDNSVNMNNRGIQSQCALLLPSAPNISHRFKSDILENMVYDDIYSAILSDPLLLDFGQKLFETKKRKPTQYREIKDRMRELGRLLIAAESRCNEIKGLADLIHPTRYKHIVDSAKEVAGFDEKTGSYQTPSLIMKLGQSLKKCVSRFRGMCMDDEVLHQHIKLIDMFEKRFEENWPIDVVVDAHSTLHERKWNNPKRIPLTDDVRKLYNYLTNEQDRWKEKLEKDINPDNFRKLCEVTLCRVLLLNRRRVGECQYMRLSDYEKSKKNIVSDSDEIIQKLSQSEKVLVKSLHRIEIRGERGRMVPVILTDALREAIEVMIQARPKIGIEESNDYLFPATHSKTGHYRADSLLRQFALVCGASNPKTLTGTQLRKHVATMVQLLSLKENELDAVANYLGHDIRVHREYYRLPHDTMQLAKISKLLINMERGNITNIKGLNLDEINVNDEIEEVEENIIDDDLSEVLKPKNITPLSNQVCGGETIPQTMSNTTEVQKPILKAAKRQKFSLEESKAIRKYFEHFIKNQKVPAIQDVKEFVKRNPEMATVPWSRIKFHVYNSFSSRKK